jgi:DNA-binding NarL/FixJ family response regulator
VERGAWTEAETLLAEALQGGTWFPAYEPNIQVMFQANLLQRRGHVDDALRLLETEAQQYQAPGAPEMPLHLRAALVSLHLDCGHAGTARELFEPLCDVLSMELPPNKHQYLLYLGIEVATANSDGERASQWLEQVEQIAEQLPSSINQARLAHARGLVDGQAGRHSASAQAFGEAVALAEANGWIYQGLCARHLRAEQLMLNNTTSDLMEARTEIARARPIALRLGAGAIVQALDDLERRFGIVPPPASADGISSMLTRREREVLELLVRGYSNRGIAEQLVISEKTAEFHVSNILGKLGLSSRVEAAAYALTHGLAAIPGS